MGPLPPTIFFFSWFFFLNGVVGGFLDFMEDPICCACININSRKIPIKQQLYHLSTPAYKRSQAYPHALTWSNTHTQICPIGAYWIVWIVFIFNKKNAALILGLNSDLGPGEALVRSRLVTMWEQHRFIVLLYEDFNADIMELLFKRLSLTL